MFGWLKSCLGTYWFHCYHWENFKVVNYHCFKDKAEGRTSDRIRPRCCRCGKVGKSLSPYEAYP